MNKLEEQIEEKAKLITMSGTYKRGAQFVIDLELPVKFSIWLTQHFDQTVSGHFVVFKEVIEGEKHRFIEGGEYEIEQVYKFWIDNKYGK